MHRGGGTGGTSASSAATAAADDDCARLQPDLAAALLGSLATSADVLQPPPPLLLLADGAGRVRCTRLDSSERSSAKPGGGKEGKEAKDLSKPLTARAGDSRVVIDAGETVLAMHLLNQHARCVTSWAS